jgi:hypothetical protein
MIFRGPGFLAVLCISCSPTPPPPSTVSKLSLFLSLPVFRRSSSLTAELGGWGGRGAKFYVGEKAWPSIKGSILSGDGIIFHAELAP